MLTELGRNTFDVPGDYEVKVVMLSAKGKKIESNTAKCTLQRPKHGDKKWDLHWEALGNPMAQRLLRYKQTLPNQKAVDALVSLTKKTSPVTASLIHYSLGKAYFKATKSLVNQDQQLIGDARKLSVGHLAEALKFDDSNPHRKEVANNLIAKLS
jgi:hypothetical protein